MSKTKLIIPTEELKIFNYFGLIISEICYGTYSK